MKLNFGAILSVFKSVNINPASIATAALMATITHTASIRLGSYRVSVLPGSGPPQHLTPDAIVLAGRNALAGKVGTFTSGDVTFEVEPWA